MAALTPGPGLDPATGRALSDEEYHRELVEMEGAVDLGSGHIVRWTAEGDLLWKHPACRSFCHVDLTSGEKHQLISRDPLHVEASLLCSMGCGTHGFIRDGRWQDA